MSEVSDLTNEIAKLRELVKKAEGSPSLQRSLIDSIKGCCAEYDKQSARRSVYLHRETLLAWIGVFLGAVNQELKLALPLEDYEHVTANILQWLDDNPPVNEPPAVKALTGRDYS